VLLWLHAFGLALFGVAVGAGPLHSAAEGAVVAVAAILAGWTRLPRRTRSCAASLGLLSASGVLVHLSGGYIEMHFHFFVMIAVITLYQDWLPFLVSIGYVVLHHGVVGVLDPHSVYNHPAAWANPWGWAGIHGAFVLAASVAHLAAWRLNEHQALHDPLTRLANRVLLGDQVERAVARRGPLAVLFLDLNDFKAVNDRHGHASGDQLLVEVARRLAAAVRAGDTLARLGGDEFAVLLEDLRDHAEATQIAERLLQTLRAPIALAGTEVVVSASVGVALATDGRYGADDLLRNADMAMYVAKGHRTGRYEVFEPGMYTTVLARLALKADLQEALARQELAVQYQPTVSLETGQIAGVEALVRWHHPQRGVVSPADFIPLAEETGLIVPIGQWVLEQACVQARQWQSSYRGDRPLTVSVNLSAKQLQQPRLVAVVEAALAAAGLPAEQLTLEITESVLVQDTERTIGQLRALKALGVRLAIDDFGTGYSSLRYLQRFPVDVLKIDKSFVDGIRGGADGAAFARTIIQLGRTLHLQIVAEGVEVAEQAAALRDLRCDLGQGFLFAHPLDPHDVEKLLRAPHDTPVAAVAEVAEVAEIA
jgi:diguanylate cyclase (GGDEF)-like protein